MPGRLDSILSKILTATLWQWLVLIIVVVILVRLVMRIKAGLREDDDTSSVDNKMLVEITELQRRGEITGSEFRSIKGRLIDRLTSDENVSSENQNQK
ncbi:MAG: hypothetical protein JKY95_11860 [Planctomycetaceae bacterium]|nr:hypothetical protein [Planctomycetaceae bacterium]